MLPKFRPALESLHDRNSYSPSSDLWSSEAYWRRLPFDTDAVRTKVAARRPTTARPIASTLNDLRSHYAGNQLSRYDDPSLVRSCPHAADVPKRANSHTKSCTTPLKNTTPEAPINGEGSPPKRILRTRLDEVRSVQSRGLQILPALPLVGDLNDLYCANRISPPVALWRLFKPQRLLRKRWALFFIC